jgi:dipeptidyl aminopeptidase/acylaminoacyl peptidase
MVRRGIADSTKLAFEGWSYGGYMTAWVVSQTSRFKAARMGAGLSDLQSMYGTTDISGYLGTFFSGIPTQKTLDFYRARSAITFVDHVTTPLLILHGGSDERVPTGQALEYFRALKDRGKTVELVFYPREGHGLTEYYHQFDKMQREMEWISRYTVGTGKVVP